MLRVKSVHILSLLVCFSLPTLPVWAQSAQNTARSSGVGKRGIYGKNSVDQPAEHGSSTQPAAQPSSKPPELTEEQKRLLQKYPLSTTSKTAGNQKAHNLVLQGILFYNQTRAIFVAANEISSSYSESDFELEVTQKGIIQARLQPADLLLYGPENAYISLRLRALQDADRTISRAISSFSQAQSLAPSLSVVPKWLRVARDTQKAIRYHIRFYQLSLKALNMGYTEKELERMASSWKAPRLDNPESTLTTKVDTQFFERLRRKPSADEDAAVVERPALDGFVNSLPDLEFKVQN